VTHQEAWEQVGCNCRFPDGCRKLHGEENREAFMRGRRRYPGMPFPPLCFDYELRPEGQVPSWAHKPTLRTQVVSARTKDGGTKSVVMYRVPLFPPKRALEHQAEEAAEAARRTA